MPAFIVFAYFWLNGNMKDPDPNDKIINNKYVIIGLACVIPGACLGAVIRQRTKVSQGPQWFVTLSAIVCFFMSIIWIGFTSNFIQDLLTLFGFISHLPKALLALTIVSWGNCLGDMAADVAMTKKGFGEMALTGCIAGPIFNMNMGIGMSMLLASIKNERVPFSLYNKGEDGQEVFNKQAVLPCSLLFG